MQTVWTLRQVGYSYYIASFMDVSQELSCGIFNSVLKCTGSLLCGWYSTLLPIYICKEMSLKSFPAWNVAGKHFVIGCIKNMLNLLIYGLIVKQNS